MLLLLLLALSPGAEAKRLLQAPPLEALHALPVPELRHLGKRVGRALRDCVPLDAKVSVTVADETAEHYDVGVVTRALRAGMERDAGSAVEVQAELSFRENPRSYTHTLSAKAFRAGKLLCRRLHRTVVKKARMTQGAFDADVSK